MRKPITVAGLIKACVPREREDLHKRIDWLINDFSFKAPEQDSYCWHALSEYVNENLVAGEEPLSTAWKIRAVAILCNKTVEQIRREGTDSKAEFIERMMQSGMSEAEAETYWKSRNTAVDDEG